MQVRLLTDYARVVGVLLEELDGLGPGDLAQLELYLFEPGESSQRVLQALEAAVRRGARVEITLDASAASALARWVEWTGTVRPRLRALARELPAGIALRPRPGTDHAKVLAFQRAHNPPSALFGGMNLGDRFAPWRDCMVHVRGPDALEALARARAGELPLPPALPPGPPLWFVANAPAAGVFQVEQVFRALLEGPEWRRLRLAMAYLDRRGASLVDRALARGAEVELLLPRDANVYPHANRRALGELLRRPGRLRARLVPGMLHAKALLAQDGAGRGLAFLGSANLKRNSLTRFGELNALVHDPAFVDELSRTLDAWSAAAAPVEVAPPWGHLRAWVEERLG